MFFKILKEKKKKKREKIGRRDIRKHNCKRRKKNYNLSENAYLLLLP